MCTFIAFSFYSFKTVGRDEQRERGLETQQEDSNSASHTPKKKLIYKVAYSYSNRKRQRGRSEDILLKAKLWQCFDFRSHFFELTIASCRPEAFLAFKIENLFRLLC